MKQKSINIAISLFLLLIATFLVSLLFSVLYRINLISNKNLYLMSNIIGLLIFFFAGGYLGLKLKQRILIHALCIMAVYALLALLCYYNNLIKLLPPLCKAVSYCVGSLIGLKISENKD